VLYHTLEPFPIEKEIYSKLNYPELDDSIFHYSGQFNRLHNAPWDEGFIASEYFNMKKDRISLEEATLYPSDVVFYDAFAPSKQPELWTKDILAKVVDSMNPGAVLTTYSSQNQFKKHLTALGLIVEVVPGPPGKKVMTRAWKKSEN
jgi:tRNA U34 5-methylaminomethyl-2-thiouridine-forming methyltransferase MnmC